MIGRVILSFVYFVLIVSCIYLFFFGVVQLDKRSCIEQAKVYGVEYQYGFFAGCNYLIDGIWVDSQQYAVVVLRDR